MKANECEYGGFDDQADCVNSVIEWYDLGPGVSSECEAAAISYFDCGAVLTCGEGSECDDEFDLLERACLEE
jgi:hypothetical protein